MGTFVQNPELMDEIYRVKGIVSLKHPELQEKNEKEGELSEPEAEKYLEFLQRELRMHSRVQQSS
jgi:hypothetical protein